MEEEIFGNEKKRKKKEAASMLSWAWTCYSHRGPCKGWESALGLSAIDAHSTGMKHAAAARLPV